MDFLIRSLPVDFDQIRYPSEFVKVRGRQE